ncbi:MAG: diaminopimelate decarboxylase [Rhodothermales bacterium]|nr:diaminopimelate decarboxylase [Rhodothermales bacterium]
MTYKYFDSQLLKEIAAAIGTPTYVYAERGIRQQIAQIRKVLGGFNAQLLYAMKANSHPRLLEIIRSEGVGIDAVSPVELKLALACGFDPGQILYSANNMTDDEMNLARTSGAVINFGDLERFRIFSTANPGSSVCIRVNPDRGAGHHAYVVTAGKASKFGIGLDKIDEIKEISDRYQITINGLHQHIGSGNTDVDLIADSMLSLLDIAAHFEDLEFVNFGGGFGIPYVTGHDPIDVDQLGKKVEPHLSKFASQRTGKFRFLIEPGRYIVAEAGALLIEVTNVKQVEDNVFVGTNSGMNHLIRPAMYGAHHEILNISNLDGMVSDYSVVGNICESSDFFAHDRDIPEVRIGDTLAIMDVGAYGVSMASHYNLRQLPAEVLVKDDGSVSVISARVDTDTAVETILGNATATRLDLDLRL